MNSLKKLVIFVKKIIPLLGVIGSIYIFVFLYQPSYKNGECATGFDGYIWKVVDFKYGKYKVVGWTDESWGQDVTMERVMLENDKYFWSICPDEYPYDEQS